MKPNAEKGDLAAREKNRKMPIGTLANDYFFKHGVKSKSSFVRVPFEEVGKKTPSKEGYRLSKF
jgi:hypothetical protein